MRNWKASAVGWGAMGGDAANMHYWEYNSVNLSDGAPVDVSRRKAESKQLTVEKDAETIANYSNPAYVLGWTPALSPLILAAPEAVMSSAGRSMTIRVKVWQFLRAPINGWRMAGLFRAQRRQR